MRRITPIGHDTAPTDIRKHAFDLNKVYAQSIGAIPTPKALVVHFDGNLTQDDLKARLASAGFELFPDGAGNTCARTVEAGELHRALVQAERTADYLERNPNMRPYVRTETVRYSPYEPPITREVPMSDPDSEGLADWEEEHCR